MNCIVFCSFVSRFCFSILEVCQVRHWAENFNSRGLKGLEITGQEELLRIEADPQTKVQLQENHAFSLKDLTSMDCRSMTFGDVNICWPQIADLCLVNLNKDPVNLVVDWARKGPASAKKTSIKCSSNLIGQLIGQLFFHLWSVRSACEEWSLDERRCTIQKVFYAVPSDLSISKDKRTFGHLDIWTFEGCESRCESRCFVVLWCLGLDRRWPTQEKEVQEGRQGERKAGQRTMG